jgi:MFS family permease
MRPVTDEQAGEPQVERPWLTHNLKVVSGVSLLQDAASEFLYPLMPILLTTVLGAPAAVVGIVEGIAEGVAAATKVVAGRVSDRYRRRPLVATGYGLAAGGKVLVAAATVWPVVLLGRSVDRLGKGIRGAPRDALLVQDIAPTALGRAFGFHRAADTAGAVIGPLLALGAYELMGHDLRKLLWIAVVPAMLSFLLVFAIREPRTAAARPSGRRTRTAPLGSRYRRVVAVLGVFSLANFPDALLLLRLHEIGFGLTEVVLAYLAYNVVYMATSYPAGVLADHLGPHTVVAAGLAVFAAVYLGLGLTASQPVAWLLLCGYGAYAGLTDGVGKAWVSGLLPAEAQGTGQGIFQGVLGSAVLLAGIWAGLAWGGDGRLPLVVSGLAAATLAALLTAAPRRWFQATP